MQLSGRSTDEQRLGCKMVSQRQSVYSCVWALARKMEAIAVQFQGSNIGSHASADCLSLQLDGRQIITTRLSSSALQPGQLDRPESLMRVANSSNLGIGDTIEAILGTDDDRITESAVERDWRPIRCAAWMAISPDIF